MYGHIAASAEQVAASALYMAIQNANNLTQELAGNVVATRLCMRDHWMAYDVANTNLDAVFLGEIPSVFLNAATAPIYA